MHKILLLVIGILLYVPLLALEYPGSWLVENGVSGEQIRMTRSQPAPTPDKTFDVEKAKKIKSTYNVRTNDKVSITNKYGKVHINTWNRNEVSIEIEMIARADNEAKAQQILDMIDIKVTEDRSGSLLAFQTEFDKTRYKDCNCGNKRGYEVNYTVSMPKNNPLQVKNSYGDVYLADFEGPAEISIAYGNLKTDKLNGASTLRLSYGAGDVAYVKQGALSVSYSRFTLNEGDNVDLKNSYSTINVRNAQEMNIASRYGSVEIASVGSLKGSSGYTSFAVQQLKDNLDMRVQYGGGFRIERVSPAFQSINLKGSYSSFSLGFDRSAGFDFDMNLQYGDLRVDKNIVQFNQAEKRSSSAMYKGKFGKSGNGSVVIISSTYGDVRLSRE